MVNCLQALSGTRERRFATAVGAFKASLRLTITEYYRFANHARPGSGIITRQHRC